MGSGISKSPVEQIDEVVDKMFTTAIGFQNMDNKQRDEQFTECANQMNAVKRRIKPDEQETRAAFRRLEKMYSLFQNDYYVINCTVNLPMRINHASYEKILKIK